MKTECDRCGACCEASKEIINGGFILTFGCDYITHIDGLPVCSIYKERPKLCREYKCWETEDVWKEDGLWVRKNRSIKNDSTVFIQF